MDRARLARELVSAATTFFGLRLWQRYSNEHIFGVRLPGQAEVWLVSIMGAARQEFGMCIYRGPQAFSTLRAIMSGKSAPEVTAGWNMLSVSAEPQSLLPPEFMAILKEAKFSGRQAPMFMAKEPDKRPRPTRRSENELLLWVLAGTLAAQAAGLLRPMMLSPAGPAMIWTLTLAGEPIRPQVSAKFEAFEAPDSMPNAGPVLLPADLKDLPRTAAHWLLTLPIVPGGVRGDDREVRAALIVNLGNQKIVQMIPLFGAGIDQTSAVLFAAFRGTNALGEHGLPARVDTDFEALHHALAPALAELDIACDRVPTPPLVSDLLERFGAWMTGDGDGSPESQVEPEPADLAAWKRHDRRLQEKLNQALSEARLLNRKGATRFFGGEPLIEEDAELALQCYFEWLIFYHRPKPNRPTLAEAMLANAVLTPSAAKLLEARAAAALSLYRVAEVVPGETLTLIDVLTGERVCVHDRLLSRSASVDFTFFARPYAAGAFWFLSLISPPLGLDAESAIAWLEQRGLQVTREGLRREPQLLGLLWAWRHDQRRRPPLALTNTEGEPLLQILASFAVADENALRQTLRQRRDIDELNDRLAWLDLTRDPPIHLASLEFVGDELVAEVNSEGRLARLQQWLTALPGVHTKQVTRRSFTDIAPDDTLHGSPTAEINQADLLAAVAPILRKQSMAWLDLEVPALGGKTPRQACATEEGRRKVIRMIRTMPEPSGPQGPIPGAVPRDEMLAELGLDGEASS